MSKWKYYRRIGCSKWTLGDSWVTKWDGEDCCHVGVNGERFTLNDTSPKKARTVVEIVIRAQLLRQEAV